MSSYGALIASNAKSLSETSKQLGLLRSENVKLFKKEQGDPGNQNVAETLVTSCSV